MEMRRHYRWHWRNKNLASPLLTQSSLSQKPNYSSARCGMGRTPQSNYDKHWPALKHSENTATSALRKNKKQKRLQPKASDIYSPEVSLKIRFTALDSLKDDATPGISLGHQEKSCHKTWSIRDPPMNDNAEPEKSSIKGKKSWSGKVILIIHYGSVNRIENFCSKSTNVFSCPKKTIREITENVPSIAVSVFFLDWKSSLSM